MGATHSYPYGVQPCAHPPMLIDSDTSPLLSGSGIRVLVVGKVTVVGAAGFGGEELGCGTNPPQSTTGHPGPP